MSEKYAFIAAEHAAHIDTVEAPTVAQMTRWLGVSKSGYYEWATRAPSAAGKRREELKIKIATLFDLFGGTYGYRRIHAELLRAGPTRYPRHATPPPSTNSAKPSTTPTPSTPEQA